MNEQRLIKAAYEDGIKKLYANYEDLFTEGKKSNDVTKVKKAEQIFSTGVPLRQEARDRALELLSPSKAIIIFAAKRDFCRTNYVI